MQPQVALMPEFQELRGVEKWFGELTGYLALDNFKGQSNLSGQKQEDFPPPKLVDYSVCTHMCACVFEIMKKQPPHRPKLKCPGAGLKTHAIFSMWLFWVMAYSAGFFWWLLEKKIQCLTKKMDILFLMVEIVKFPHLSIFIVQELTFSKCFHSPFEHGFSWADRINFLNFLGSCHIIVCLLDVWGMLDGATKGNWCF